MNKVNLILHAHLPYVRHLEYPKFLEENWLFESLNETYIPLLKMLEDLDAEDIPFHLSICFPRHSQQCSLTRLFRRGLRSI